MRSFVRARASCGRWCVVLGRITRYWWYRRGEETRMPHHTQQKKQQSGWGILMLSAYRMAAWADAELVQKAKQHGLDTDFSTECVFASVVSPRAPSVGRDVSFTWKYRTNSGKEIPAVSCRSASIVQSQDRARWSSRRARTQTRRSVGQADSLDPFLRTPELGVVLNH